MGRTPCLWWPDCILQLRVDVDRGAVKDIRQDNRAELDVSPTGENKKPELEVSPTG